MGRFPGVDYLAVDSVLNEQELLVRQTARQFVDDRVLPVIRDAYAKGDFPVDLIREMGELGFLGANLEGYGCAGMSNVEYGLIMQELERGDSGVRSFVVGAGRAGDVPDPEYGSEEQKEKMAAAAANAAKAIGCFGLTEPDFGSNPGGHDDQRPAGRRRLGAQRREDLDHERRSWRTSRWSGRAPRKASAAFWWNAGTPGYTTSDIHGKWSMRASVTSSLLFPIAGS